MNDVVTRLTYGVNPSAADGRPFTTITPYVRGKPLVEYQSVVQLWSMRGALADLKHLLAGLR